MYNAKNEWIAETRKLALHTLPQFIKNLIYEYYRSQILQALIDFQQQQQETFIDFQRSTIKGRQTYFQNNTYDNESRGTVSTNSLSL